MHCTLRLFAIAATLTLAGPALALDNDLAKTPPMGWNSWNAFQGNIDETLIRKTIDAMAANGMKEAGYTYINIDDCWSDKSGRDKDGNLVADPKRFAGGIKALADHAHEKGLKLGIYSDAGTKTCAGFPGSASFEDKDAALWASWGIDYLKYDWCNTKGLKTREQYTTMRDALLKTRRPMVFSLCEWGTSQPWTWATPVGNLWRTTGDISPNWKSVMDLLDRQVGLEYYAGPGHWNDPDMLEVGNGKLTAEENRAHFSLWCLLAAPLIAGNDLRKMPKETLEILTNKDVIAIDQNPLGIQGAKVIDDGPHEVWARPLGTGSQAVILLNREDKAATMTLHYADIGWKGVGAVVATDLWTHQQIQGFADGFSATISSHGVLMLRLDQSAVDIVIFNPPPVARLVINDQEPSALPDILPPGKTILRVLPYSPYTRMAKVEVLQLFPAEKLVKTFNGGPYTIPLNETGIFTFKARVTDDQGVSAESAAVTINLAARPTPPASAPATQK
jgi:alpha-galactosidase